MALTLGLLATLPLALAAPQDPPPAEAAGAPASEAPPASKNQTGFSDEELLEILGGPLVVNGEAVTLDEFKRILVIGVGASQLEKRKYDIFLADEVARRVEAGEPAEQFEMDQDAIDAEMEKMRVEFLNRYPTLDYEVETQRAFVSLELYRTHLEQQQLFDKLFLQNDPAEWPELTLEAIRSSGGDEFVQSAQKAYDQRVRIAAEQGLAEVPPESPQWKDIWRSMVIDLLNNYMEIEQNPDDLPPGVLARVEGQDIYQEEVFAEILPSLTDDHIEQARHWLALMTAVRQRLEKEGALLSPTAFRETFFDGSRTYHNELKRYEMLAHQGQGYPSTYLFFDQQRLEQSYKQLLQKQVDWEAALKESLSRTNWITGLSEVDVEMILISAWDFRKAEWKPDGWGKAETSAGQLTNRLDKNPDEWGWCLDRYSEFYDPPMPKDGSTAEIYLLSKGRFGPQTRNNLLGCLGESQFHILMNGYSIADYAFFDQEVGTIVGPLKGKRGYYFSKLLSRKPIMRPLDLNLPVHRDTAEIYFLRFAFVDFVREVERDSEFVGWTPVAPDYEQDVPVIVGKGGSARPK